MNAQNTPSRISETLAMRPMACWMASFDYVFGFQLKLIRDYFGMRD